MFLIVILTSGGSASEILVKAAANSLLLQWSVLVNLINSLGIAALAAGAPPQSYYASLGAFMYKGIARTAYTFHMICYCVGGVIWYSLFGIVAVCVSLVGMALGLFGYVVPIIVSLPIGFFELIIGLWLLLRGIEEEASRPRF
jgi:hypothetical protein